MRRCEKSLSYKKIHCLLICVVLYLSFSLEAIFNKTSTRFLLHDTLHLQIRARYTLLAKYACPEQLNTADRPSSSPSEGKPAGWLTENVRVTNVSALALRCERWKKMRSNLSIEACNTNTPEGGGGGGKKSGRESLRRRRNNINLSHMHRSGFVFRWIIGLPWQPTCSECICNGRRLHASHHRRWQSARMHSR